MKKQEMVAIMATSWFAGYISNDWWGLITFVIAFFLGNWLMSKLAAFLVRKYNIKLPVRKYEK